MEIVFKQGFKHFHLKVDLINKDKNSEVYKIYPPNNPDKYFILKNNRPFIREVKKLKHRRIDWEYVEGAKISPKAIEDIIALMENPIKPERDIQPPDQWRTNNSRKNRQEPLIPLKDRQRPK